MEPADLGDAITSAHDEASVADTGTCVHRTGRSCTLCGATSTPQWREGPMGPKTLCNACGVKQMRQAKKRGDLAGRNGKRATASKAKQTDTSTRPAADSSRAVKGSHLSNSSAIVPAAFPTITAGNDQYHLPHHDYNDSLPSAPVGSRPAHIEQETEGTETMGAQGDLPEEDEAAAQELLEFASLAAGSSASEDNGDADTWQLGHDAQVEQEQEDGEWLHGGGVRRGKRRREPSSRARALTELLDADLIAGRGRVGSSPAGRKRRIDPLVLLESYSAWQVSFDAVPHHTQPQRSPMKWFGMPAGNSETASGQGGLLQRASPSLQSAMGMAGAAIRYSTSTLSDDSAGIGMPHSLLGITPLSTGGLGPGGQGLGMGRGLGLARLSVETLTALDNLLSMAGNPRGPPPISDMPAMLQPVAAPLTAPLMPGRLEGGADDMDSECDDTTAAPAALLSRLPLAQLSAGERAQLLAMQEAMKTACARLALAELEKRATQQMLAESEEVARQAHARLQKHLQHLQHELQEALGALGKLARPVVATSVATIPLGPGGLRWPAVDPFSSLATPSPASCFPPC